MEQSAKESQGSLIKGIEIWEDGGKQSGSCQVRKLLGSIFSIVTQLVVSELKLSKSTKLVGSHQEVFRKSLGSIFSIVTQLVVSESKLAKSTKLVGSCQKVVRKSLGSIFSFVTQVVVFFTKPDMAAT